MASSGKTLRWSRFFARESGRALIVPIDHGLTLGPISGLSGVREIAGWIRDPAIDGVVAHKGMIGHLAGAGLLSGRGVMLHLNGMTSIGEQPDTKHRVTSVETAVRLGADAVSVQVNFAPHNHAHNLALLGQVVDEADAYALPVMAMVYPATPAEGDAATMRLHRHFLRIAYELGVDAIKTAAPVNFEDVHELLDGIGEHLPVLFSGGSLQSDEHLIGLAKTVAGSSAKGLCAGRNVFQHRDPGALLTQVRHELDS
jgi:fructose-bisphosphate aldolase, class I